MRVLLSHNYYQQQGGEDQVFAAEAALLTTHGHFVERFTVHNDRVDGMNPLSLARATVWNVETFHALRALLRERALGVAHFHNTFPLISPSAYYAANAERVPVVQTLHNYRLLCPSAVLYREGQACERCLGRQLPWPGVVHACYRGSRAASGAVATMIAFHRTIGTWSTKVEVYVAPTEFARQKFIAGGLPADRIMVKPNFVHPDPGVGDGRGGYALFVGRLSPEKGVATLVSAWERTSGQIPLKVVGDGPDAPRIAEAVKRLRSVEWVGRRPPDEVYSLMGRAAVLVTPSECYETFGRVAVEAFATGTPVIASGIGAMAELVEHGRTGWLFKPGDAEDLAAKVEWAWTHPRELAEMRREARAEYEAKYTAERNYAQLMEIYQRAIERRRERV